MRKSPLSGLSWLQLIAGALAAMTSAWVASYLGVAGTIIGAAVGSLVASIASALYVRGLDRGTTLITESGSVVSRSRSAGGDDVEVVVADEAEVTTDEDREFSWKRTLTWAGLALAAALVAIGGYELATGESYGKTSNPSIGRPFSDGGGSDRQQDEPRESTPTDQPTEDADQEAPPAPAPTTDPTPDPAPTTAPSAPVPAPLDEEPQQQPDAAP